MKMKRNQAKTDIILTEITTRYTRFTHDLTILQALHVSSPMSQACEMPNCLP